MNIHRLFLNDGGEGAASEPTIEITPDGGIDVTVMGDAPPAEPPAVREPTEDELLAFAAKNPHLVARFAAPQVVIPEVPKQPAGFDPSAYVDEEGSIDMQALGAGVQRAITEAREAAIREASQINESRFGATVDRLAQRTFADDLVRENDLGDAGRKYIMENLKGMSADQLEALPVATRRILADAAENHERKQSIRQDDAVPGAPVGGITTGYKLNPSVDNPLGWTYDQYCRSVGANPKDKRTIDRHLAEGILVRK
jgi:hypothetical protein